MSDTTQAIRDALLAEVVATATAGIYAAMLAERERCAALVDVVAAQHKLRYDDQGDNYDKGVSEQLPAVAAAIREGMKS